MVAMTLWTLGTMAWCLHQGAIALGHPAVAQQRVRVLWVFWLLPPPYDRMIGAAANVALGIVSWFVMLWLTFFYR